MAEETASQSRDSSQPVCQRCKTEAGTLPIRAEHVCQKCFIHYVNTKAIKRMETYRERGSKKAATKILLPVSLGPSSTSLLYILDNYLQTQLGRMGRTSYEMVLVHVGLNSADLGVEPNTTTLAEKLKSRFSRHAYIGANIDEALDLQNIDWEAMGLAESRIGEVRSSPGSRVQLLLNSLPSATSRRDIESTLLNRLLVDIATKNECESILFGDSTTRLAEKTLTETAKGRGFSLPWQVSDSMSPFAIHFRYPMRDLLKKEIVTYSSLVTPLLTDIIIPQSSSAHLSASVKSTTIDDLMTQYFESVEENYPSIVANVVRTSSKLITPTNSDNSSACGLCGMPVTEGTDGIYGWAGDQSFISRQMSSDIQAPGILCYGCSRSING